MDELREQAIEHLRVIGDGCEGLKKAVEDGQVGRFEVIASDGVRNYASRLVGLMVRLEASHDA